MPGSARNSCAIVAPRMPRPAHEASSSSCVLFPAFSAVLGRHRPVVDRHEPFSMPASAVCPGNRRRFQERARFPDSRPEAYCSEAPYANKAVAGHLRFGNDTVALAINQPDIFANAFPSPLVEPESAPFTTKAGAASFRLTPSRFRNRSACKMLTSGRDKRPILINADICTGIRTPWRPAALRRKHVRFRHHRRPVLPARRASIAQRTSSASSTTRSSGADDGELSWNTVQSEGLSFDDGRVRNASFDTAAGVSACAPYPARRPAMRTPPS